MGTNKIDSTDLVDHITGLEETDAKAKAQELMKFLGKENLKGLSFDDNSHIVDVIIGILTDDKTERILKNSDKVITYLEQNFDLYEVSRYDDLFALYKNEKISSLELGRLYYLDAERRRSIYLSDTRAACLKLDKRISYEHSYTMASQALKEGLGKILPSGVPLHGAFERQVVEYILQMEDKSKLKEYAIIYRQIGHAFFILGRYDSAIGHFENEVKCLKATKEIGSEAMGNTLAKAYVHIITCMYDFQPEASLALYEQQQEMLSDKPLLQMKIEYNIGVSLYKEDDYSLALTRFKQALRFAMRANNEEKIRDINKIITDIEKI